MCTVLLPPGVNPIAVNKYISINNKYRIIHKSVKHFKNSQQIDYATDRGNPYVDRERNCWSFFKENPAHIIALICRQETVVANMALRKREQSFCVLE